MFENQKDNASGHGDKIIENIEKGPVPRLNPPSVLPDLARDLYESDKNNRAYDGQLGIADTSGGLISTSVFNTTNAAIPPASTKAVQEDVAITRQYVTNEPIVQHLKINTSEPNRDSVPGLDMNLVRQLNDRLNNNHPTDSNIHYDMQQDTLERKNIERGGYTLESRNNSYVDTPYDYRGQQPPYRVDQYTRDTPSPALRQPTRVYADIDAPGSGTNRLERGFFADFEDFIIKSDFSDASRRSIIENLLAKDIVGRMTKYHDAHKEGLPFYLSGNDLNSTTQREFDELRSLEHSWLTSRQRLEVLEQAMSSIETDMRMHSEELKLLLGELVRRASDTKRGAFESEMLHTALEENPISQPNIARGMANNSIKNISVANMHALSDQGNKTIYNIDICARIPAQYFYLKDGRILRSIRELADVLPSMSESVFRYHVDDSKNDFVNWIEGVFGYSLIARKISNTANKDELAFILLNN